MVYTDYCSEMNREAESHVFSAYLDFIVKLNINLQYVWIYILQALVPEERKPMTGACHSISMQERVSCRGTF